MNAAHYYEMLGLKPGASEEEIKQAYKDLLTVWNPEKFINEPSLQQKAREMAKKIDEAYEKLILYLSKSSEQTSQPELRENDNPKESQFYNHSSDTYKAQEMSQSEKNTTIISPASGTDKGKLGFLLGNLFIVLSFLSGGFVFLFGFIGGSTTEDIPNRGVALIESVFAIGTAFGLLKRKKIGLYLVYINFGLLVIVGLSMIMQGTSVGMVCGLFAIGLCILWVRYFQRRKDWFK